MDNEIADLRAALQWYANKVDALDLGIRSGIEDAVTAAILVLSMDGGKRARDALNRKT